MARSFTPLCRTCGGAPFRFGLTVLLVVRDAGAVIDLQEDVLRTADLLARGRIVEGDLQELLGTLAVQRPGLEHQDALFTDGVGLSIEGQTAASVVCG